MEAHVAAVSLSGLHKRYGARDAVRDLTLDVQPGEIFGFLGLNGAGKTTTIRILLDLLRPTGGTARVFGHDCQAQGLVVRQLLGYLPGEITLYGDMTGLQVLDLLQRLGRGTAAANHRTALLDRFQFAPADLRRRIRDYSTGMKRKLGLVQAFQHDPALLILDEPTEGLDPLMQEAFYDLLREVRQRGRTVFMSSHVLSEVERVCDRVAVLRDGRLAVVAAVEDLRRLAPRRLEVSFAADVRPPDPSILPPEVVLNNAEPRRWSLVVRGPIGSFIRTIAALPITDVVLEEPRLEDVVMAYYREGQP